MQAGEGLGGRPTIYDLFLHESVEGAAWADLDDEARFHSARRHGRPAWTGPRTAEAAPDHLDPGAVELTVAGGPAAGGYPVVPAALGRLPDDALAAPLACAGGGPDADLLACRPLSPGAVAGRLVLVERGGGSFEEKARRVQEAGGLGMILGNTAGETQVLARAEGDADDVTIPVLSVGRSAGLRLEHATCPDRARPLAGGRFDLRAIWFTDARSGQATVEALTEDTLYATFFDAANVELVVKVLDACTVPGNGSFWVFAAGLTNVGVELRVIDTETGLARRYINELGTRFARSRTPGPSRSATRARDGRATSRHRRRGGLAAGPCHRRRPRYAVGHRQRGALHTRAGAGSAHLWRVSRPQRWGPDRAPPTPPPAAAPARPPPRR